MPGRDADPWSPERLSPAQLSAGAQGLVGMPLEGGPLISPLGAAIALSEVASTVALTATGLAFTGACEYAGLNVRAVSGTVNIAVYDATSATGTPIHTESGVTLGGKPWMGAGTNHRRANTAGLYVVISGGGTVTVDALVS